MKAEYGVPVSKDKINMGKAVPLKTPFLVYAEPTNFCNLKCVFCPNSKIDNSKKSFMSMSTFKKIIDDIKEFPDKIKVFKFCGVGESLMHRELPEMIAMAADSGCVERIIMYSNGVLLNPELNRRIVKAGLNQINISVEAIDGEGYVEFAKTKVDFDKFVANIRDLYQNKEQLKIYLKIHHLALKDKSDEQKFYDIFGDICDSISVEGISHIFPDFYLEDERKGATRYGCGESERYQICAICFKTLNINADGSCSPCSVDWGRKVIIGNVLESSLKDIWNNDKLRGLRKRFCTNTIGKNEACHDCADYYMSGHENLDEYADEILRRLIDSENN